MFIGLHLDIDNTSKLFLYQEGLINRTIWHWSQEFFKMHNLVDITCLLLCYSAKFFWPHISQQQNHSSHCQPQNPTATLPQQHAPHLYTNHPAYVPRKCLVFQQVGWEERCTHCYPCGSGEHFQAGCDKIEEPDHQQRSSRKTWACYFSQARTLVARRSWVGKRQTGQSEKVFYQIS